MSTQQRRGSCTPTWIGTAEEGSQTALRPSAVVELVGVPHAEDGFFLAGSIPCSAARSWLMPSPPEVSHSQVSATVTSNECGVSPATNARDESMFHVPLYVRQSGSSVYCATPCAASHCSSVTHSISASELVTFRHSP